MSYFMNSHSDYLRNITLSNVPEYFTKLDESGDSKSGQVSFHTVKLDDAYGDIAQFEVSWSEVKPIRFHVGKQSVKLMNEYINIGVGFSKKELIKINGHDAYIMFGARREAKHGSLYITRYVIATFCCDVTKRQFRLRMNVFKENYDKMEDHILEIFKGLLCH